MLKLFTNFTDLIMKFYSIVTSRKKVDEMLEQSCKDQGIEYVKLEANSFSYSMLDNFEEGDILYRTSTSRNSSKLQSEILSYCPYFKTIYHNLDGRFVGSSYLIHRRAGLNIPKTITRNTNQTEILKEDVNYLGGFPVILKITGGSKGIGVIKVDTWETLVSLSEYLLATGKSYILREFIESTQHVRMVVLGNKVIAAELDMPQNNEFRSNNGISLAKTFPEEVNSLAINAVQLLGKDFGGVDLLINNNGVFILEVNSPCNFASTQEVTGIRISDHLINYLKNKKIN